MEYSEAQALLTKHSGRLQKFLGITETTVIYKLQRSPNDIYRGECANNVEYSVATIWMDPYFLEDEADFLGVLFHELCHVILGPFDLFKNLVFNNLEEGTPEASSHRTVWTFSCEKGVSALVKIWTSSLRNAYLTHCEMLDKIENTSKSLKRARK